MGDAEFLADWLIRDAADVIGRPLIRQAVHHHHPGLPDAAAEAMAAQVEDLLGDHDYTIVFLPWKESR